MFVVLGSPFVGAAEQGLTELDLSEAVDVLTKAEFDFPDQASELWQQDDGLPAPEYAGFAAQIVPVSALGANAKQPD